jgi:DNA polymerase III delta subunit
MPEQSYTQIMTALGAKTASAAQLSTVYLIQGGDDSLKREVTQRLLELALDPGFADFDRETIDLGPGSSVPDGESDPTSRILSAVGMAPFMSPRKVVVVASVQRLPKERQLSLAEGVKQLGAVSLLILIADAPEFEAGRPKGRQLEAVFKKSVAAFGTVINCDAPQAGDLKARAQAMLSEWGKTWEPGVIDALADHASAVATRVSRCSAPTPCSRPATSPMGWSPELW